MLTDTPIILLFYGKSQSNAIYIMNNNYFYNLSEIIEYFLSPSCNYNN